MTKVISIALFGDGDKYAVYLPAFVRAHLNLFPLEDGWRLRVHIDDVVRGNAHGQYLARLFNAGLVDVAHMGTAPLTMAMLWRLAPVFDERVEHVFCRDLDAPPMPRDRSCCDSFIRSQAIVHTIHDNVMHTGIMGGLCGFWAPRLRAHMNWQTLVSVYDEGLLAAPPNWDRHGTDQEVLNRILLRKGGPSLLEHRFNGWHAGAGAQPKRGPGSYGCAAWTTAVPDRGRLPNGSQAIADQADRLGNHLGCAGYDHDAARKFWDRYGNAEVAAKIAACEQK